MSKAWTSGAAWETVNVAEREKQILDNMRAYGEGTGEELAARMGCTGHNKITPRLRAMERKGLIEDYSAKRSELTGRWAFLWRIKPNVEGSTGLATQKAD